MHKPDERNTNSGGVAITYRSKKPSPPADFRLTASARQNDVQVPPAKAPLTLSHKPTLL